MMKQITCPECDGRGYIQKCETWDYGNGLGGGRAWSEICYRCNRTGLIEVPMTNADRIRAMSDEELVEWLSKWCRAAEDCHVCPICDCPHKRNETWLDWLQHPCGGADRG